MGIPSRMAPRCNFSAAVTGMGIGLRYFVRWDGLGKKDSTTSLKAVYETRIVDWLLPFEDINNNARFDPGIDLDLDGIRIP